jgi:hypothetical protein
MRQYLAVALLATAAYADKPSHDPIDMTAAADKVEAYRDPAGKFYVLPKGMRVDRSAANELTFYGDGRTMYQQRVVGMSNTATDGASISVWAPRSKLGTTAGTIERKPDGTVSVRCRFVGSKQEKIPLTKLSDDETATLLKARYEPPLWERSVFAFARNSATTYYLVDTLRAEYDGGAHRVFVGRKGQMKQVAVTDIADDSAGTTIVTKAGQLSISKDAMEWTQGKKKSVLTPLEPTQNIYLIYRDLGVYGQLGTVCEDQ